MKKKYIGILLLLISIGICFIYAHNINVFGESTENTQELPDHRLQWWLSSLNWDEERPIYSANTKIAIIDTGIEVDHPDLISSQIQTYRVASIGDEKEKNYEHGTAVAGVIGAYPIEDNGVIGINPQAQLYSIDVTDDNQATTESIIEGIELAISLNVDIINISLGVENDSSILHEAITKAYNAGIVIVASAGNYMENDVLYPAKYDEVLAVGSLSKKGTVISPLGSVDKHVIFLPGENIVTTYSGDKQYIGAEGTSLSAPMLSGIISLILSSNSDTEITEIYDYFNKYSSYSTDIKAIINDFN